MIGICPFCGAELVSIETLYSVSAECPHKHYINKALKFAVSEEMVDKMIGLVVPGVVE